MYDLTAIVALLLTAITMALSLAHALEWPGKARLTEEQYRAVQPIYYPGFTSAGAAEPLAIVALAVLLALTPAGAPSFPLIVAALAAAALTHLLYWALTAPVNKFWLQDAKLSGPAQRFFGAAGEPDEAWTVLRDRWERSHAWRAVTAMAAFLLTAIAAVRA